MTHRDEVERAMNNGFMKPPWLFMGLFLGSFILLMPLEAFAPQALGIDSAIFKESGRFALYAGFLAAITVAFTRPSGAWAIFLAVLGGGGVAALSYAGAIGMELLTSRGGIPGAAAHFALRVGIMIPAWALAAFTIYGLAPRPDIDEPDAVSPEAPAKAEPDSEIRKGFVEVAPAIAVMVGGFLAMFGGWEVVGWFAPGFPHPAMLSMAGLFGAVIAGPLAFVIMERAPAGSVKRLLAGMGLVALVWAVTTAAAFIALAWGDLSSGEEGQWEAAIVATGVGVGAILLFSGPYLYFERWRRERRQPAEPTAAATLPAAALPAPIYLISALTTMVVLHAAAQAVWREDSSIAFLVSIMPAMAMISARPRGIAAWVYVLGIAVAAFALMLGGFMLGAWAEQRWAGGSAFLTAAIMLAAVIPTFLLAVAILFRLRQFGHPNPATKPEEGAG